jgi:hypothetical protein
MAQKAFEVPQNKTFDASFLGFLAVARQATGKPAKQAQNGRFTGPILGLAGSKNWAFRGIILTVAERT